MESYGTAISGYFTSIEQAFSAYKTLEVKLVPRGLWGIYGQNKENSRN
jgi:hypothetical protein